MAKVWTINVQVNTLFLNGISGTGSWSNPVGASIYWRNNVRMTAVSDNPDDAITVGEQCQREFDREIYSILTLHFLAQFHIVDDDLVVALELVFIHRVLEVEVKYALLYGVTCVGAGIG